MGNSKRVPAREEVNDATAEPDPLGRPASNENHTTIESSEEKNARVAEEYIRIKLELDNENVKLQLLTQQRTTQQALSNPNAASIGSMFATNTLGLYMYRGSQLCCLNASLQPCISGTVLNDTRCKHEVCARATSTGLSWKELDTIKWYDMRIRYERTDRMKGALMKQRDVELVRVKQLEDEEYARTARRFNKREASHSIKRPAAATEQEGDGQFGPQDLDTVVFESRMSMMQIQKYNIFVGVRQQSMADIAKCSDIVSMAILQKTTPGLNTARLEEQLRQAQIRTNTLEKNVIRYGEKIAEAAQASNAIAVWQRSNLEFDLDLEGTDPHLKELCDLVKELLTHLGMPVETIDDIERAEAALAHIMSQPVSDISLKVQESLDHIKEVILRFRVRSDEMRASEPNTASYQPMPASSGDLRNRIIQASVNQGRGAGIYSETYSQLIQIEDEAVLKVHAGYQGLLASPVKLVSFLDNIKATAVAKSPVPGITEAMLDIMKSTWSDMSKGHALLGKLDELSDQILVANISGLVFARAEKKVEWLMAAFTAIEAMMEAVNVEPLPARVTHALQRVQTSVQARTKASMEVAIASKKAHETTPISGGILANVAQDVPPVAVDSSTNLAVDRDPPLTVHEQSIVDTSEYYTAGTASRYASYLFQRKYCPGCATLRIAQLFAVLLTRNPQQMDRLVAALSAGHSTATGDHALKAFTEAPKPELTPKMWMYTVACGVRYITDLFHALGSDVDIDPASERKVPIFSEMVCLVVEGVVVGSYAEQMLNLENSSISTPETALIIKKFSQDSRFACAAFQNSSCSQYTADPEESRSPQTSMSSTVIQPILEVSKPEGGHDISSKSLPPSSLQEKSNALTTEIMPGPTRRRLLPRGERHQSQDDNLEAAVKIAGMGLIPARKMSDFYTLLENSYNRAGLPVPSEVQYVSKQLKMIGYGRPITPKQDHIDCHCLPCIAKRVNSATKTSKFVEDFSDAYDKDFEVTIDGRAVTDDELLSYTGATVERIRSIPNGEATLEYTCWVAHQVGEAANIAEIASEELTKPVERFEEFFSYYAPIPLELDLALEVVKGNIWRSPECRDLFPSEQWPLVDDILAIMGRIGVKQLTFANGTNDWLFTESMVPEPLTLRKDRPEHDGKVNSELNITSEAPPVAAKPFLFAEEPQKSQEEVEKERLQTERDYRQTERIQAEIETIRQVDETTAPSAPSTTEIDLQRRFSAFNLSAKPLIEYMGTILHDDTNFETDFRFAIAVRVQTQHLDCVRMMQLVAESKGWDETAAKMKEHLDEWRFQEDEEGHYPDMWAGEEIGDDEDEDGEGDEQGAADQEA
jgi:hypothetical protein